MSVLDFQESNEDLLYDNFLYENYNHCSDYPDNVDTSMYDDFVENEYQVAQEKLRKLTQKRPSLLRVFPNSKLLKTLVKSDVSKLDGVIVNNYAVLYPI